MPNYKSSVVSILITTEKRLIEELVCQFIGEIFGFLDYYKSLKELVGQGY